MDDTSCMNTNPNLLDGKNVGVIGFNARPIAASLRKQGARTFVSDYWGDLDLASVSTECIAILSPVPGMRQRQPLELPIYESLIENFEIITKNQNLDYVIIGSGFDDHSETLNDLHRRGLLIGTSPEKMKNARDLNVIEKLVSKLHCKIPHYQKFQAQEELMKSDLINEFPFILRPLYSGGGAGIRYIRNHEDLERILNQKTTESYPLVLQEYIKGTDISCSVLSTGKQAKAVSVQRQLIGSPAAGRNCDFAYCGNSFPSGLPPYIDNEIIMISEHLAVQLELKGSIGFDYMVDSSYGIWLMEVNPRIQGTLEMLEAASSISITNEHVRSSRGNLINEIPHFKPVVKMIVYSRRSGIIPDLTSFPDTFDRSPKGVHVNQKDPICTVISTGRELREVYRKTCANVWNIQKHTKL